MSKIVGISPRSFPTPDGATAIVLTILVHRVEGTFKAYAAIVPDNSLADPDYAGQLDFVKENGNPLRFAEAKINFPSLQQESYSG